MADEISFLGEIDVKSINLISSRKKRIDIKGIVGELSLYEDIFSNTMSGHVLIEDGQDLINTLPMTGEELIEIEMVTPTLTTTIKKLFYVYKLQARKTKKRSQTYMLNFCSLELIQSSMSKVSKAFQGPIDITVKNIFTNTRYMAGDDGDLLVEPTKNTFQFIAPYWTPLETINWLGKRAINRRGVPNYLFYEDNQKYHFRQVDSLILQPTIRDYIYSDVDANTTFGVHGLMDDKYKVVESLDTDTTFDYLRNIHAGMFASKLYTLDMTTKNISSNTFDYIEDFSDSNHLNNFPLKTTRLAKKKLASLFHLEKNNYLNGKVKQDQGHKDYLLQRNSLMEQLSAFKVVLKVHGRTDVRAGQTINFTMPEMRTILKDEIDSPDSSSDYYSGKYLITAIRHQIINGKHTMFMEVVSDSFVKQLLT